MTHLQIVKSAPAAQLPSDDRCLVLGEQFVERLSRVNALCRKLREMGYQVREINARAGRPTVHIAPGWESSSQPLASMADTLVTDARRNECCASINGVAVIWPQASRQINAPDWERDAAAERDTTRWAKEARQEGENHG